MEYIKKEDVVKVLKGYIEARERKTCNKQVLIEKRAFEYALAVVNKVPVIEIEND